MNYHIDLSYHCAISFVSYIYLSEFLSVANLVTFVTLEIAVEQKIHPCILPVFAD